MPSLAGAHLAHARPFVVEGGHGVALGVIDTIDERQPPAFFFDRPRRILRCLAGSPAAPGRVARSEAGQRFVLGDQGFSPGGEYRSFLLFEVTGDYQVRRKTTALDPLTGVARPTGVSTVSIPMCVEPFEREDFDRQTQIDVERFRAIAGAPLFSADTVVVDGVTRQVRRVNPRMGVHVAEVR